MNTFWSSFEVACVCRSLSYENYKRLHEENKIVGAKLSATSYRIIGEVFNLEMDLTFSTAKGE